MTRSSKPRGTGLGIVLILLAGLFFASGLSRLSLGVVTAFATENPDNAATTRASTPPDAGELFEALRAREARLSEQEDLLEERAEALRAAEERLRAQMTELQKAEDRLSATLALTETAAESDLTRLTTVFEHMKPPQAAALFSTMETEFAAGFIARLNPQFAGEVMAELDPTLAYGISAVLAGRHANTPRN
jgi:flagellar motility protein MotE (MotC chaperone)